VQKKDGVEVFEIPEGRGDGGDQGGREEKRLDAKMRRFGEMVERALGEKMHGHGEEDDPEDVLMEDQAEGKRQRATPADVSAKDEAGRPRSHIVGLARHGLPPFDIGEALAGTKIQIDLLQLLDSAPRLRTDLQKLIAAEDHGNRRKKPIAGVASVKALAGAAPDSLDLAKLHHERSRGFMPVPQGVTPDGRTVMVYGRGISREEMGTVSTCFIAGFVNGIFTVRLMLDCGASLDCISPGLCHRLGLIPIPLKFPWKVTLADDNVDYIRRYVIVDLVVGNIVTGIIAFVYGNGNTDMLLSNNWLCRVRAQQDWDLHTLTLRATNGYTSTIPFSVTRESTPIVNAEPVVTIDMDSEVKRWAELLAKAPTGERMSILAKLHELNDICVAVEDGACVASPKGRARI
jgi:predicted aspartyl protease